MKNIVLKIKEIFIKVAASEMAVAPTFSAAASLPVFTSVQ